MSTAQTKAEQSVHAKQRIETIANPLALAFSHFFHFQKVGRTHALGRTMRFLSWGAERDYRIDKQWSRRLLWVWVWVMVYTAPL
jgi:hypothetical protein